MDYLQLIYALCDTLSDLLHMQIIITNFNTELITVISLGINIDEIFRWQLDNVMKIIMHLLTIAVIQEMVTIFSNQYSY